MSNTSNMINIEILFFRLKPELKPTHSYNANIFPDRSIAWVVGWCCTYHPHRDKKVIICKREIFGPEKQKSGLTVVLQSIT